MCVTKLLLTSKCRFGRRTALALGSFAALTVAGSSHAGDSVNLRQFSPSTDPVSGIYLEPAATPGHLNYNVGLFLSYSYGSVVLDSAADGSQFKVLEHQLTVDPVFNIGLTDRLAFGVSLPMAGIQKGDAPTATSKAALGTSELASQAIGDVSFSGKWNIVAPTGGDFGGFALSLHERFTLPTGTVHSLLNEGSVSSTTRVLAEYRLVFLGAYAALGATLRGNEEDFACGSITMETCVSRFGHEIPWGFGVSIKPQALGVDSKGRMTWFLETFGHLPLSPSEPFTNAAVTQAELGAGVRYAFGDVSLLAGASTRLVGAVGSPPMRGLLSLTWAPRKHDADNDGVDDELDQCRELAEDRDGFQDSDGCPEGDNDDDGSPDGDDRCPETKEDEDGFQDDDGCPDPDNDADRIPDEVDTCPDEAGNSQDPGRKGCPDLDVDHDGVLNTKDQCPDAAEDLDGHKDEDGCPDEDNDSDGVSDSLDGCPDEKGLPSNLAGRSGCADADQDTYALESDNCPDHAENFQGTRDDDGCPEDDPRGKTASLALLRETQFGRFIEPQRLIRWKQSAVLDDSSVILLRAVAAELLKIKGATLLIGVRGKDDQDGMLKAIAIASAIEGFTKKGGLVETVHFSVVSALPSARASGVGLAVALGR